MAEIDYAYENFLKAVVDVAKGTGEPVPRVKAAYEQWLIPVDTAVIPDEHKKWYLEFRERVTRGHVISRDDAEKMVFTLCALARELGRRNASV